MIPYFVAQSIVVEYSQENGISGVVTVICMFALIGILIFKLINVMMLNEFYDRVHIFTTVIAALCCFFFVLIGSLINQNMLFAIYLIFSVGIFSVISLLTVVETFYILATKFSRPRMDRNINDRKNRGYSGY